MVEERARVQLRMEGLVSLDSSTACPVTSMERPFQPLTLTRGLWSYPLIGFDDCVGTKKAVTARRLGVDVRPNIALKSKNED